MRTRKPSPWLLLWLLTLVPSPSWAKGVPLTLEHLSLVRRVSSPQLSPDGKSVAYVVSQADTTANRTRVEIKVATVANGRVIAAWEGSEPRWAPDGKTIAYQGETAGQAALFLYDLAAGTSRKLVDLFTSDAFLGHEADKGFAFSPDGTRLAYCGTEPPPLATAEDLFLQSGLASGTAEIHRTFFKSRTGLADDRRTHLWLVAVSGPAAGKPRLLTPGPYDEHSLSWSPDGKQLAFVSNRSSDSDTNYADDLWSVEVASGILRQLTATPGTEMHPTYSPDGRRIAFLAMQRPVNTRDSPAEDAHLYLVPAIGGQAQALAPELDRRVASVAWHPDGASLLVTIDDNGRVPVLRVPVPAAGQTAASPERFLDGFSVLLEPHVDAAGTTLAYLRSEITRPAEVWVTSFKGKRTHQVSRENQSFLNTVELQNADNLTFPSFDGQKVQLFLFRPVGYRPGQKYPLVLWVHGGPHGMFAFTYIERLQVLAAAGYGVLAINPRGSTGYGQAFTDGTRGQWGGGDYRDLMAGLDWVLATYPWVDAERLGVAGWSYGGFMTNWVITQTPRFKAAVAGASLANLVSFYGTSLYSDLLESEFAPRPWEGDGFAELWRWSPLAQVGKVTTPVLFLHGESDQDVPITQAEEMYTALRRQGKEAVLVRYPGEGHGLRKPRNVLDSYRRIVDWFRRFLPPTPPPTPTPTPTPATAAPPANEGGR